MDYNAILSIAFGVVGAAALAIANRETIAGWLPALPFSQKKCTQEERLESYTLLWNHFKAMPGTTAREQLENLHTYVMEECNEGIG